MSLPSFAAEASVYRTSRSYRGSSGRTADNAGQRTVVGQQFGFLSLFSCQASCFWGWFPCMAICSFSPSSGHCELVCRLEHEWCLNRCEAGGPSPGECPRGQRCCERDESGRCTICVPSGAECP